MRSPWSGASSFGAAPNHQATHATPPDRNERPRPQASAAATGAAVPTPEVRAVRESGPTPASLRPDRATTGASAHQFGLADVQRRDPLDDLLIVMLNFHRSHHLRREPHGRPPVGAAGNGESSPRARSNMEGPTTQLPAPDSDTASTGPRGDDVDGRPESHFQPGTGRPGLRPARDEGRL